MRLNYSTSDTMDGKSKTWTTVIGWSTIMESKVDFFNS